MTMETVRNNSPPVSIYGYEEYCRNNMNQMAWTFYSATAGMGLTYQRNIDAYKKICLKPKVATVIGEPNLNIHLKSTNEEVAFPIGICPTAFHKLALPGGGEVATICAAKAQKTIFIGSIHPSLTLEETTKTAPGTMYWQQNMVAEDQQQTLDLIQKAEKAGAKAHVLQVDRATGGIIYDFKKGLVKFPRTLPHMALPQWNERTKVGWEDTKWFISKTSRPVILKGIITPEDAEMAVKVGAKGIIVSNQGGRSIDGLPATIEVLPSIVQAVNGAVDVYIDGGIRTGVDVFKALAYGAKMVFIGRPILWGLAHSGQAGVENVLSILKEELVTTMKLMGTASLDKITMDRIYQIPKGRL